MLAAMLVIGAWITGRIEESVVANSASAGALYLESFVSPLSQELAANERLSEPARLPTRMSTTARDWNTGPSARAKYHPPASTTANTRTMSHRWRRRMNR